MLVCAEPRAIVVRLQLTQKLEKAGCEVSLAAHNKDAASHRGIDPATAGNAWLRPATRLALTSNDTFDDLRKTQRLGNHDPRDSRRRDSNQRLRSPHAADVV